MTSARSEENPLQMCIEKHLRREGDEKMLKLMKYEFFRQLFSKGFIVGFFLTLVAGFFGFYWVGNAIGATIIVTVLNLATIIILFFAPFEFSFTFDKDMNSRQGYLLALVPQKSTTILLSKLLVALLQSVVLYTLFFTVVPFCERLCENKFGEAPGLIGQIVWEASEGLNGVPDIIVFWFTLLTVWLFLACLGMFVTAIPGKGKLVSLLGCVFFFVAIFLVFFLLERIDWLFDILKTPAFVGNIAEWVYIIGIDLALFLGTAKLMDKKVSL